jgi:Predicted Fe-S oxidoreductases
MIDYAIQIGFRRIFIDTNGLLVDRLKRVPPESLAYIRVSLDGPTAETHDKVRGAGAYESTLGSIRELIKSGYSVAISSTVFAFNVHEALALLRLADDIGISLVNYHVFSEEGLGADNPSWSLAPQDWIDFCGQLEAVKTRYRTSIWYPPTWTTKQKLGQYVAEGYRGCLGCSLDRLSIFPDGACYVCSVLFDEPVQFGLVTDESFVLNRGKNEFEMFTAAAFQASEPWLTGCPAEQVLGTHGKTKTPAELIPMCRCWKSQA